MSAISRRRFLTTMTRGTASVAVLGVVGVACSDEGTASTTQAETVPPGSEGSTTSATAATTTTTTTSAESTTSAASTAGEPVAWERINLGFVSAYVLARGGEAAVVDTGTGGSEGDIEAGLSALGLGWEGVGHVILTHSHGDHVGSLDAVLTAAPDATGYIGEGDLDAVGAVRPLQALNDGDVVFDLQIVGSPGHTPGHISVFDPASRLLVAGDALNESGGAVTSANPQFTADQVAADLSVTSLSLLEPETIVVGHGEPIIENAAQMLSDLAVSL